ncbi:hypothetical protein [Streptomyces sp. NPDC014685]|uniref:hypothetical protein n=1 Tax=Streptomyces sp. NPDC014685 TaxID=3364881 RepID=UPI0036F8E5EF
MLKPWRFATERNYWNSNLNGGLPLMKKRDPVHEGTFLVHDIHHFLFTDPIVTGSGPEHLMVYMAARMLSEAASLVFADLSAVDAADLQGAGYDVSRRAVYPIFASMRRPLTPALEARLVGATAEFALTGSTRGLLALGASAEAVERFGGKYGRFFSGDYAWNVANFRAMTDDAAVAYHGWLLESLPDLPTTGDLVRRYLDHRGLHVNRLLTDRFITRVAAARRAPEHGDPARAQGIRHRRFLAGQARIFFDYPTDRAHGRLAVVRRCLDEIALAPTTAAVAAAAAPANEAVLSHVDELHGQSRILSHEAVLFRSHVPHYPAVFVYYDRSDDGMPSLAEQRDAVFGDVSLL